MHYGAYEFPRIPIPRTPVNRGKKRKGRGIVAPALLILKGPGLWPLSF